ncbi:1-(5-phosphoribosyl)-5-[(5-phosphoribosylamino)methylideneamino]imidazole-4-carboxamide isomerase [bacterium]|nr:1-(5-phosphoribosyl)-5-[(5-phosphoribosylamino)methylideneamino]imidazole-4-carboxamide isomerase [bacterium]
MFEVIPAIDILEGEVVRLTQGDYSQVDHYTRSPADTAKDFVRAGATRIHLVDLDGARDGHLVNFEVFKEVRNSVDCTLELGGGIRDVETAELLFGLGIDYLIVGSLLIKDFARAQAIIEQFPYRIIAGVDAKNGKVAVQGWLEVGSVKATELIEQLNSLPIGGIIYTDISRDGTYAGPNLAELKKVAEKSKHPVIASGGVGDLTHIRDVRALEPCGVTGCVVGKAVLSGRIPIEALFAE